MVAQEEQLELCEHVVGRFYYVGRPTEHMMQKGRTCSGATLLCRSSYGANEVDHHRHHHSRFSSLVVWWLWADAARTAAAGGSYLWQGRLVFCEASKPTEEEARREAKLCEMPRTHV